MGACGVLESCSTKQTWPATVQEFQGTRDVRGTAPTLLPSLPSYQRAVQSWEVLTPYESFSSFCKMTSKLWVCGRLSETTDTKR